MNDVKYKEARRDWEKHRYREERGRSLKRSGKASVPRGETSSQGSAQHAAPTSWLRSIGTLLVLILVAIALLTVLVILGTFTRRPWFWPAVVSAAAGAAIASCFWLKYIQLEYSERIWRLERDHAVFIEAVNAFGGTPKEYRNYLARQFKEEIYPPADFPERYPELHSGAQTKE